MAPPVHVYIDLMHGSRGARDMAAHLLQETRSDA
jgi:hypothetical protein